VATSPVTFELREAAEALLKQKGITSGRWTLNFELQLGAGLFGMTPDDVKPSAFVQINRLQLVEVADGQPPPTSMIVDLDAASDKSAKKKPTLKRLR
jgi:hypothetical protein